MKPLVLNRDQSRRVDALAVQQYGFSSLVLMENAGRGTADVLCRQRVSGPVTLCCGPGNNGGDGFVVARHLDLRDVQTRVLLFCDPERLEGDAAVNCQILRNLNLPVQLLADASDPDAWDKRLEEALDGSDWIVDALLGTGTRGRPRPPLDRLIQRLNASPARKLAVDVPSGLDCDTGEASEPTFRAERTCTFFAPKPGLLVPSAAEWVGQLDVLDIGIPTRVWTGSRGQ